MSCSGRAAHPFRALSAAARRALHLVAVFHSDRYVEGWNTEGDPRVWIISRDSGRKCCACWSGSRLGACGAVRPRAGQGLGQVAHRASRRPPPIRCCNTSHRAPAWQPRTRSALPKKLRRLPVICRAPSKPYVQERYLRTARVQIMARVYGEFYHAAAQQRAAQSNAQCTNTGRIIRGYGVAVWRS